jgi:endoglucanase
VLVRLDKPAPVKAGDILMWDVGPARIRGDRLYAPAIDDLGGVAAAMAAFDAILRAGSGGRSGPDVRLLLTRAEEIGFVGCIAACKSGQIPRGSRILALETSRSYAESPIGSGPIVRVGDKTATFDPDLTYRVGRIAQDMAASDPSFKWQRKLMPGGTCEASAYQAYGYTSTCLCVPLGNYHNMNFATGRIAAETISVGDFAGLVRLLVEVAQRLDDGAQSPSLRTRLDKLFKRRRGVLI